MEGIRQVVGIRAVILEAQNPFAVDIVLGVVDVGSFVAHNVDKQEGWVAA